MLCRNAAKLHFATMDSELAVCKAAAEGNPVTCALPTFEAALRAGNCLSSWQTSVPDASLRCTADVLSSLSGGDSRQRAGGTDLEPRNEDPHLPSCRGQTLWHCRPWAMFTA